ncbi:MAG: SAM-dependent methyltransferase [Desulfovibrio sp.]|nr:MAG: SAM-dependent methyltransferase [Desulfovibrio sp.]
MNLKAVIRCIRAYPIALLQAIDRETNRFYRASFLSGLLAQPFAGTLTETSMSLAEIARELDLDPDSPELEAWLDMGVSLGVLRRRKGKYAVKSRLARKLIQGPQSWQAYFRIRVEVFYHYFVATPGKLVQGERFSLDDSHGELYAQSSRTVEPVLLDVARNTGCAEPGPCALLEVGCGSGVYIQAACEANPELFVVGLELQPSAAALAKRNIQAWGLGGRATIEQTGLMDYSGPSRHDIVTLHNLIYYFPLQDRPKAMSHVYSLLKPGGKVILSTLLRSRFPSIQAMHLWSSMNQGCGPLPHAGEIPELLKEAGFLSIESQELIPGMWCFTAHRPGNAPSTP